MPQQELPCKNTVQFNGYYGCSLCYHPGKVHSGVIKYPIDVAEYSERNEEEMLADMLTATEEARSVRGVKGPTPLVNIPHFPVVWGFPPDFMHCCLLGVTRQLAELWFGSSSGEAFYIGSPTKIGLIDRRLVSIKPPSIVSRVPRPISERKYWKASEWYNWLLFFSLPCLLGVLPQPYLLHLSIFVRAMFLLLQKSISNEDGNMADLLITSFVCKFQLLYGTPSMTFNVHSLTHLAKSVKKWGPLWTHSCFPFESCNGQIKKYLCGNKGIALQAMHKFMLLKALPLYGHIYNVSERVTSHCNEMLGITSKFKGVEIDDVQLLGNPICVQLSDEERFALNFNGFIVDGNVESFCRLRKNGFTFHTYTYSRATVRSDKYFCLLNGSCGELHRIITHNGQCLILYKEVLLGDASEFDDQELGMSVGHIKRWMGTQENFQVRPAHHLSSSCVIVTLVNRSYVCFLPNHCVL
ncbi:hypothetical protein HOLleu_16736 [Holothuria leucospilota]|uniref:Uncharacterized protein n=1 Tax=Holothuria leucospilota TaxID=206669 RepID=A0A9Q1H806_HOLLE|nr:hypothetical protein HOLleu_16736 [Holothuria leucospilota]